MPEDTPITYTLLDRSDEQHTLATFEVTEDLQTQVQRLLSQDVLSLFPKQELTVEVNYDALLAGSEHLIELVQQLPTPQPELGPMEEKTAMGSIPHEDFLGVVTVKEQYSTAEGTAVYNYVVQKRSVADTTDRQNTLSQLRALIDFLHEGKAASALLRRSGSKREEGVGAIEAPITEAEGVDAAPIS